MLDANQATWFEFKLEVEGGAVAILPFGALEQHGPHLPLSTDTVMSHEVAYLLAEKLDAILLPSITYGEVWNNTGFPGSISLSVKTVQSIAYDIGSGLANAGVRALIIVNGHHGNAAPIELAVRDLQNDLGYPALLLNYPGLEEAAKQICDSKPAAPSFYHADEVETSIMLKVEPDLVMMDLAEAEYPEFPSSWGSQPIKLDTFCKSGVFGDPTQATVDKGKELLDLLVLESMKVIREFLDQLTTA